MTDKPATALRVRRVQAAYQQVADQLKQQILAGELTSGTRLPNEGDLAQLFGVSRSTVREALRLLASQHLIDTTRGVTGGSFVSNPDAGSVAAHLGGTLGLLVNAQNMSVSDLLEGRLILEPSAARLAAERATPELLDALKAAADNTPRPPSKDVAPHWEFHAILVAATGNPLLHLMCEPVNEVLRTRLDRARADREFWDRVDAEHRDIHQAVADRDGDAAERLTRDHLLSLRPLYEKMDDGFVNHP